MILFGCKHRELEEIIRSLEANRSNNYKDNAQDCFVSLQKKYSELSDAGKLSKKQKEYYTGIIKDYAEIMSGYTHKDQTPYWV